MPKNKIRVLVVDDSALMRRLVARLLEATGEFTVIGTAADGHEAIQKIISLKPDVVSLDLEMPKLDGLGVLRQVMVKCPTSIVMLSAHTVQGAKATMQALSLGAVDFVAKPIKPGFLEAMIAELALKLKTAAKVTLTRLVKAEAPGPALDYSPFSAGEKEPFEKLLHPPSRCLASEKKLPGGRAASAPAQLVVVGSSTGGPAALQVLIPTLPKEFPAAVVVVQHLPRGFSESLAEHLNRRSNLEVRHAQEGERIVPGQVFVAPAGCDFSFQGRPGSVYVSLEDRATAHSAGVFHPSVDSVMQSAAQIYGASAVGVLLTGMGKDGVRGMTAICQCGGVTMAQDESTCVVFGMPKAAIEAGAAQMVLPLEEIAQEIIRVVLK